ncbi:putative retinol dehydrogenase 12 [Xylariales sp. PMI_506]|nr:putative retinol dehydrogenase 12 [Xylariales sp. PMI_506]
MSIYDRNTVGLTLAHDFSKQVKGRTFLLTGPSKGGIGAETVISLAHEAPEAIILVGRSPDKAQPTIDAIQQIDRKIKVKFVEADLTSMRSVRTAAKKILEDAEIPKIDVIMNNAGVMACPFQTTEDGFEFQLAANYLGHFVLTNSIMPKVIAAGAGSRLVIVTSSAHRYNPFRAQDPNYAVSGSYSEVGAYGSSKSALILYAVALNKRLARLGIRAYAVHPGSISTNLQDHVKAMGPRAAEMWDEAAWKIQGMSLADYRKADPLKTTQEGCATTLRAALDPGLVDQEGVYLKDVNLSTDEAVVKGWATDPELAEQCWALTEELIGEKFQF